MTTERGLRGGRPAAHASYQREFATMGIDIDHQPVEDVAARIRASRNRESLISALDGWAKLRALLVGDESELVGESRAEVYYADPRNFNDPLDCDPVLQNDINRTNLERLCFRMLNAKHGREGAQNKIEEHRYMSTDVGDYKVNLEAEQYYVRRLTTEVKRLLDAEMGSHGVLSLTARYDSPLMWSHYAEEHRGLCIEYDLTQSECHDIRSVAYDRPTSIRTSELIKWKLEESDDSKASVYETYFLTKSSEWEYEKEWRGISPSNGVHPAPFNISAVYFGLRCDDAAKSSIVKLLADSANSPEAFYDMFRLEGSSNLDRREIEIDEMMAGAVRTSPLMDFENLP